MSLSIQKQLTFFITFPAFKIKKKEECHVKVENKYKDNINVYKR